MDSDIGDIKKDINDMNKDTKVEKKTKSFKKRVLTIVTSSGTVIQKIKLKDKHKIYRDIVPLITIPKGIMDGCEKSDYIKDIDEDDNKRDIRHFFYSDDVINIKTFGGVQLFADPNEEINTNKNLLVGFSIDRRFMVQYTRDWNVGPGDPAKQNVPIPEDTTKLIVGFGIYLCSGKDNCTDIKIPSMVKEIVFVGNIDNGQKLNVHYPPKLKSLKIKIGGSVPSDIVKNIPDSVEYLEIHTFSIIKRFPKNLKTLILPRGKCTFSGKLPDTVEKISSCHTVDATLYGKYYSKDYHMENCHKNSNFPTQLPESLVSFACGNEFNRKITKLPEGLKYLHMSWMKSYNHILPELPKGLHTLSLPKKIRKQFPKIPKSVHYLLVHPVTQYFKKKLTVDELITALDIEEGGVKEIIEL